MCKEKGPSRQKEEAPSLFSSDQRSANTLLTGGGRHAFVFLDDALANPSTGSSRLFHYQPMTKTPDLNELTYR